MNNRKCWHPGSAARCAKFGREGRRVEECFWLQAPRSRTCQRSKCVDVLNIILPKRVSDKRRHVSHVRRSTQPLGPIVDTFRTSNRVCSRVCLLPSFPEQPSAHIPGPGPLVLFLMPGAWCAIRVRTCWITGLLQPFGFKTRFLTAHTVRYDCPGT